MEGYRFDGQANARAFTLDGWLRTGDAGALDDAGRLRAHGRLDEAIVSGAEKIWPQEVESVLREHPRVVDVGVTGRPDPEWGMRVVAYVVPEPDLAPPTTQELRDFASDRIARFKAPRDVVLVESLPRTASGKLRRSDLAPS
jgi:acyl-CoA synthetase (AMP-forming)/AMP-acid ligase II